MNVDETKRQKARNLRYRKAIAKDINFEKIQEDLWEIIENCEEIKYYFDDDNLLEVLDNNEDELFEFKAMFSDLCYESKKMQEDLQDTYIPECFNDFFAVFSNNELLGYDIYERDYYGLSYYEERLGREESKKRLNRLTKNELIEAAGSCFEIYQAYIGLINRYCNLKDALDILKDKNSGYLQMIKQIESLYELADKECFVEWGKSTKELTKLADSMPTEFWLQ